uniref:Uncharacterized protein n=1 Tax=Moniliophthora roreri TaxID=221103 RepID=A0A0W0FN02_MONRR
MVSHYKLIAS